MAKAQAAAKTAAKSNKGATPKVTDKKADPLADLGLDAKKPEVKTETAAVTARTEVNVGEIEFGEVDYIPQSKRATGGSKYKFDDLAAPKPHPTEKGRIVYANFIVRVQDGVDEAALKRSVQSATTQANKAGKGEKKYFITRAIKATADKPAGVMVIRTDDRPAAE